MKKIIRNSGLITFYRRQEKFIFGIVLCLSIFLIWSWVYSRTSLSAWQTPLGYFDDGLYNLGVAKAFMDGDILPVLSKWVAHLNAPFVANWNDSPIIEEFIFAIMGWLGRAVGLLLASNIMVVLAHILAGLSFWYVSRKLNYRPVFAFAGAILFAFSHYSFIRNFGHINLTYYWHIPLMLLVTWWAYSSDPVQIRGRQWSVSIMVAVVSGLFNPYYSVMFLQFLGFAVLLHLVKKEYLLIRFPLLLIGLTVTSFLIMNADTFIYSLLHGSNDQAVYRNLAGLEIYGLKIPELVYPPHYHSWQGWADFGQRNYFDPCVIKGEVSSPYLGMIGLAGLLWLMGTGLYRLLQGRPQRIPIHAWQTLWILLFSVVGGINLLFGTFGLVFFRGTNRYSIFISAIALLFLVRQLSRICPKKMVWPLALGIAIIGLWDQLPPKFSEAQIKPKAELVQSDQRFAKKLESQLPKNSMVFQLPVTYFPEAPPIYQMSDYEHFRPYFFTQHLRYSYGTNRGRGDANWQITVSDLAPAKMATVLEGYGFGAIMINRKGYKDKGVQLISELVNTNRPVLADDGDLVAIKLEPAATPVLPITRAMQLNVFKQEITTSVVLQSLKADEATTMQVNVKNISNESWPSKGINKKGTYRVSLGFQWLDSTGKIIKEGRCLLPYNLLPGLSDPLDVKIQAPSQSGDYTLCFSMVQEHVCWFHDKGAAPLLISVKVKHKS